MGKEANSYGLKRWCQTVLIAKTRPGGRGGSNTSYDLVLSESDRNTDGAKKVAVFAVAIATSNVVVTIINPNRQGAGLRQCKGHAGANTVVGHAGTNIRVNPAKCCTEVQ